VDAARLVGSANAAVGMAAGIEILRAGGSALDAVEAATRLVEDNPDDHTVGYGGYPNLLGQVELDASIMDGTSRRCGAVGSLRGYRAAITVARAVMERLPHVLVAGDGAARLAAELGLEQEDLLTPEAAQVWQDGLDGKAGAGVSAGMLSVMANLATDPERAPGTVNVLALDTAGNIAAAVSTSGWAWKYPGRLGDSPVIGAGSYADSRFGAAACTGWGELAIRAGTARMVVAALEAGSTLEEAGRAALLDVASLDTGGHLPTMSVVTLAAGGVHAAFSNEPGKRYVFWEDGMKSFEEAERVLVRQ
jgi:beta-aspartyl-peptidase (threonine type)